MRFFSGPASTTYLATKLHLDRITTETLAAIGDHTASVDLPQRGCQATDIRLEDATRTVVVHSDARATRRPP